MNINILLTVSIVRSCLQHCWYSFWWPLSCMWVLTRSTWLRLARASCPFSTLSCLLSHSCGVSSIMLTALRSRLLLLLHPLPTSIWAPRRYIKVQYCVCDYHLRTMLTVFQRYKIQVVWELKGIQILICQYSYGDSYLRYHKFEVTGMCYIGV